MRYPVVNTLTEHGFTTLASVLAHYLEEDIGILQRPSVNVPVTRRLLAGVKQKVHGRRSDIGKCRECGILTTVYAVVCQVLKGSGVTLIRIRDVS